MSELEDPVTADHTAADGERDDTGAVEPAVAARRPAGRSSRIRRLTSPLAVIGVPAVLSVGLAAGLYFAEQRPDDQTDAAVERAVISEASHGAAAVLSYKAESLEGDMTAAKSHLTGGFLDYYSKFSAETLGPTAKQKEINTKATVARAAVSELHPDSAKVLVFVNQLSRRKDGPFVANADSVIVSLTKRDGAWLISGFEPV